MAVEVQTAKQTRAEKLFTRILFFDDRRQLLDTVKKPATATRGKKDKYAMPVFFGERKAERLFFRFPTRWQNR